MLSVEVRPLHPSTTERVLIDGPAGQIEIDLNDPGPRRRGIALIAHPNPLQGGTRDNKVVTTLAKTLFALGHVTLRPNFRGVGASEGVHDHGIGETDDLVAVAAHARGRWGGELPLLLAGFSFGGFVQTRVAGRVAALLAVPRRLSSGLKEENSWLRNARVEELVSCPRNPRNPTPHSAPLRHFTIRIAATSVRLRGLVQPVCVRRTGRHVLSLSSLLPGLSLSLITPTLWG